MPPNGVLDPGQLAIITAVLDEYCRGAGIAAGSPEREELASRSIQLYLNGVRSPGDLKLALARARQSD